MARVFVSLSYLWWACRSSWGIAWASWKCTSSHELGGPPSRWPSEGWQSGGRQLLPRRGVSYSVCLQTVVRTERASIPVLVHVLLTSLHADTKLQPALLFPPHCTMTHFCMLCSEPTDLGPPQPGGAIFRWAKTTKGQENLFGCPQKIYFNTTVISLPPCNW